MVINNKVCIQWFTPNFLNTTPTITFPISFSSIQYLVFVQDRNTGDISQIQQSMNKIINMTEAYDYRTLTSTRIACNSILQSVGVFAIGY